jgi:4-cresol dehydrogenase (hydroxylating)
MRAIRRRLKVGEWNGSGGLYGTKAQVKEARSRVRQAIAKKTALLKFVDDRLLRLADRLAAPLHAITRWDIRPSLRAVAPVYKLLQGVPTDLALASVYWRKKSQIPAVVDPDRDRCGLFWCSPVVPNRARDINDVTQLVTRTLIDDGFEPQMSISMANERMSICVATISYDRDVPGEDERAFASYTRLTDALVERGYPPYRLNVRGMHYLGADGAYGSLLRSLKQSLDPNDILAPGRYESWRDTLDSDQRQSVSVL